MSGGFDPGALLAHYYDLKRGPRVCLRLPRAGDLGPIEDLFARRRLPYDEMELGRLVRSDPRRRLVICATALVGSVPAVLGVGSLDLVSGEVDLLAVDEDQTEGLGELICAALRGRAHALAA